MAEAMINPLLLSKLVLWTASIIVATYLLKSKKLGGKTRLALLLGGTLVFGFVYGQLTRPNPNPMTMVTNILLSLGGFQVQVPLQLSVIMLALMLVFTVASNRSICGWGCQLGLLQDALYHLPAPKFNVSRKVTIVTRIIFLAAIVALMFVLGLNLIGVIDPFKVFQLNLTVISGAMVLGVVMGSVFFYRPWCRFLCPFGLVGFVAEQFSFYRPRVDAAKCVGCMQCVKACPTGAMKDFYDGERVHNDCYACGRCLQTCKVDALAWRRK